MTFFPVHSFHMHFLKAVLLFFTISFITKACAYILKGCQQSKSVSSKLKKMSYFLFVRFFSVLFHIVCKIEYYYNTFYYL